MTGLAPVLFGREAELAAVGRRLEALTDGEPSILGIAGEPGIGKTRLLGELAGSAARVGALVMAGRAAELQRDLPFGLLVDALDAPAVAHAGALADLEPDVLAELAGVLPGLGRAAGVVPGTGHGERHRTARAFRALLERLAADRPVALVLDDVQWADPTSVDALALLHRPPTAPVLVALAARDRPGAGARGRARPGRAQRCRCAARARAARRRRRGRAPCPGSGGPRASGSSRRVAATRSTLTSCARGLGGGRPGGGAPGGLRGVPRAVQAALAGELAGLPGEVRTVLQGAAVAGDPFEPELAAAAAAVGDDAALAALDALLAADLVRATEQPRRFRFRHPLVRAGGVRGRRRRVAARGPCPGGAGARCARGLAGAAGAPRRAGGSPGRPRHGRAAC